MGLFRNWSRDRAAKRYARELPGRLVRSYGASERYTLAQIRAAVSNLNLDPRFIAFAYAAFVPEEDFISLGAEMPVPIAYNKARILLARYRPHGLTSASGEPFDGMPGGVQGSGGGGDSGLGHGGVDGGGGL